MTLLMAFVSGFLLAFVGSMPPTGPIAVLVLARGVTRRYREGVALALGAALPEAVYAGLGMFGASALIERYPAIEWVARLAGVLVLVALGVVFARFSTPPPRPESGSQEESLGVRRAFSTGFWISAANPTLVLTWSTSAAMLYSLTSVRFDTLDKVVFSIAVAAGATSWFCLLIELLRRHSDRVTVDIAQRVIRLSGLVMIGMAFVVAVSLVRKAASSW